MATRKYLANIDLNQNELQNPVFQNLALAPPSPKEGQIYFNTTNKVFYGYKNGSWVKLDAQGTIYAAGAGIDSSALANGTIKTDTTIASKTDIGDGKVIYQKNGSSIATISVNQTTTTTVNYTIPITASDVNALPNTTTISDLATTTQMAAINSGITSTIVAQVGTNASSISDIENLIPSQATTSNKLADKNFVNSSVQTATANFRGNWTNWTAVPTSSADYPEDYAGSKVPTVNDYLVVQDASDYTEETLEGTWRFKYTGDWSADGKNGWLPEYQVNETPLTADQLAALNSGVTSTIVTQVGTNASDILNLQTNKQDKLTPGSNISISGGTISATNTTYSNGSGLSLTGTTFAVDFTAVATASQGAKADTAAQVYSESNPALTASGGQCTWTVTHNLGSRNVEVKVYEISSWEEVVTSVALTSTSIVTVKLNSTSNIAAASYQVVVAGH